MNLPTFHPIFGPILVVFGPILVCFDAILCQLWQKNRQFLGENWPKLGQNWAKLATNCLKMCCFLNEKCPKSVFWTKYVQANILIISSFITFWSYFI